MDVRVCDDLEALSVVAADLIATAIRERPRLLLGAATGATPTRTYELLAAAAKSDPTLTRELRVLTIDEWGGLTDDDPATCDAYARSHLLGPLGVDESRYTHFSTSAESPTRESQRICGWLADNGPIDLCILGLGVNGHIALVEPAPELHRGAQVVPLSQAALGHGMLSGARRPPTHGLTLGVDELLGSRHVLLLVSGAHKREQLARLLEGPIATEFPASLLWLHGRTTLLCDRAAAATVATSDKHLEGPPHDE